MTVVKEQPAATGGSDYAQIREAGEARGTLDR